jgi:hypothetical protein
MTAVLLVGVLVVIAASLLWIAGGGDMNGRMPTQVPPRRFSAIALALGAALVLIGLVGRAIP